MAKATVTKVAVRERPANFPAVSGLWVPRENSGLVVELPGERLMATVAKVLNPDMVIVELTTMPLNMAKQHRYEKGEFVPCERVETGMETVWRAFRPRPKATVAEVSAEAAPSVKTKKRRAGGKKGAVKTG